MTKELLNLFSELLDAQGQAQAINTRAIVEAIDRNTAVHDRNAAELKRMNDIEQYKAFPAFPVGGYTLSQGK